METGRKRPLEGEDVISSKKRVLSTGEVQIHVNGRDANEPEIPVDGNLEVRCISQSTTPRRLLLIP